MVRDLRSSILGQRCANVYDLDDKTYLFKFAAKDEEGESEKIFLLVESGIRFHTTKFQRAKNDIPSPFAMKLRKYIRTKKIEDIKQIGMDRVVDIRFGSGDTAMHILLEFYANGNLILCDHNYEVLALLRSHQFEADVALKVGELYPIRFSTNLETSAADSGADAAAAAESEDVGVASRDAAKFLAWAAKHNKDHDHWQLTAGAAGSATKGRKRSSKKLALRQLLLSKDSPCSHYGPEVIDHMILAAGLTPSLKVASLLEAAAQGAEGAAEVMALLRELGGAAALLASLDQPLQPGYILHSDSPAASASASASASAESPPVEYVEFSSHLLRQHAGRAHTSFPTFGEAVDAYFYRLEAAKQAKAQQAAEAAALKKLDKVRNEARNHAEKLERTQESMQRQAQLVARYADEIDRCLLVLNSCLGGGMPWRDIEEMVAFEARQGNAIAAMVKRLRLDKGRVVLRLPADDEDEGEGEGEEGEGEEGQGSGSGAYRDEDEDEDEERGEDGSGGISRSLRRQQASNGATVDVDLDLSVSAHANARVLFSHKKAASQKHQQTLESSSRAVAAVEAATIKTIEAQRVKQTLREARKVHW